MKRGKERERRETERGREKGGRRGAWRGEATTKTTGGVAIETKAPLISL